MWPTVPLGGQAEGFICMDGLRLKGVCGEPHPYLSPPQLNHRATHSWWEGEYMSKAAHRIAAHVRI